MSQEVHVFDIRRSFIPADPASFAATYHDTQGEDNPEPRIPLIPYAGRNFMPTNEGWASFFGINVSLAIDTLVESGGTGRVDDLFVMQTNEFVNILVALCDDGIWTKLSSSNGAWTQVVALTAPDTDTHSNWSKCVIENVVYVYRQGEAFVYQASAANEYDFSVDEFAPTSLNMTGQLGIFKAGGRLGFWDSENSTAWCALGDPTDATADDQTLAGATIFQDIVGRIVNILQHGTGFIIYCTKSIVHVTRNEGSPLIWKGRSVFNGNGISYREECCFAEPDTKHFAFTTQGLIEIQDGQPQFVVPEVSTYLKEARQPVYPKVLNGRYLFLPFIDTRYILGTPQFDTETFDAVTITFGGASYTVQHPEEGACKAINTAMQQHESIYLYDQLGYTSLSQATGAGVVPIWEDHLSFDIAVAVFEAFKATGGGYGSISYFESGNWTNGGISRIDGGTEYMIPEFGPGLVTAYTGATLPIDHTEDNTQDFYAKQEFIWMYERFFMDYWIEAIKRRAHTPVEFDQLSSTMPTGAPSETFGPYVDLSFFSESNKYYGLATKSAWLQRSLTRLVYVDIETSYEYDPEAGPTEWTGSGYSFTTFTGAFGGGPSIAASTGKFYKSTQVGTVGATQQPKIDHNFSDLDGGPVTMIVSIAGFYPGGTIPLDTGGAPTSAIDYYVKGRQRFHTPRFRYTDVAPCTYKNLGYTKIKGHGHYTLLGAFVEDDAIGEAADYTDQCGTPPAKTRNTLFNGTVISSSPLPVPPCQFSDVVINSVTYTYPVQTVTIPSGSFLIQIGSIEPIYPSFQGAFVYDMHYKKWGKMVQTFKRLLDYFPINNVAGDASIPYDTFLPKISMLGDDGEIYNFDQYPNDSVITFGKYGQYRKGFTTLHEVRLQNRTPLSGTVQVQGSLDGKVLHAGIAQTKEFTDAVQFTANIGLSARWYDISVTGNYDITNLEARSSRHGKR